MMLGYWWKSRHSSYRRRRRRHQRDDSHYSYEWSSSICRHLDRDAAATVNHVEAFDGSALPHDSCTRDIAATRQVRLSVNDAVMKTNRKDGDWASDDDGGGAAAAKRGETRRGGRRRVSDRHLPSHPPGRRGAAPTTRRWLIDLRNERTRDDDYDVVDRMRCEHQRSLCMQTIWRRRPMATHCAARVDTDPRGDTPLSQQTSPSIAFGHAFIKHVDAIGS